MSAESKQAALDLLHRGIEMARAQGRPWWITLSIETAILALEQDEHEELAIRLLSIGYGWKETEHQTLTKEVANLRKRLADQLRESREQRRRAGQKKTGHTKANKEAVRSEIEELRKQGLQEQQIDPIIAEKFGVKGRTRRGWQKNFWQ
jgi:hypothetical protein